MDDVIFFERLQEDTERISDRLNLPTQDVKLPHLKAGVREKRYQTADYYNSTSRRITEEAFQPEIEAFGYTFPGDSGSSELELDTAEKIDWLNESR